jgi:hypothetical protein
MKNSSESSDQIIKSGDSLRIKSESSISKQKEKDKSEALK